MGNISERIRQTLLQEYGLEICDIHEITTGVGGDTFLINTRQGRLIYKIVDANEMNRPEEEPKICDFLFQRGARSIPISKKQIRKLGDVL